MDVETGPQEDSAYHQGGELLTISTDGIEVFMPSKIADAIRDIQSLDEGHLKKLKELRQQVRSKKDAEAQHEVNYHRESGRDDLLNKLADTYRKTIRESTLTKSEKELQDHSRGEKKTLYDQHIEIKLSKRKDFEVKLNQAVINCKKNYSYYFHVVFFVFDSANLSEIVDYGLSIDETINKKLSGEHHSKKAPSARPDPDKLKDELLISIKCDMNAKAVIQELQIKLHEELAGFKAFELKGKAAELPETLTWVTILCQTQFYLSQIDMDTVLQFLYEEHFTPRLRFILVFKKLKDAESLTAGKKCMLYQEPIEKHTNYTYEFFSSLIEEKEDSSRTLIPPSLMADLLQYHEDYRFHFSQVISHVLGLLSLHYSEWAITNSDTGDKPPEDFLTSKIIWKIGIPFFLRLINIKVQKLKKSEEYKLLIIQNMVQLYADPKLERFEPSKQVASESKARFKMIDLALAFLEDDGNYLDRLKQNCYKLMDEYKDYTSSMQKKVPTLGVFGETVNCIINKIDRYQNQHKDELQQAKKSGLFNSKTAKQGPLAAQDRANAVLLATQAKFESQVPDQDRLFVEEIQSELEDCLKQLYQELIEAPIKLLSQQHPHRVLSNHRQFESILNPNIVTRYVKHLSKIQAPKSAIAQRSSSAEPLTNVAELATKVLFTMFAEGPLIIQVEELISPFSHRMQDSMRQHGIKFRPVQDTSLLSQQTKTLGAASSLEAQTQLGYKYLFYYAINTLKRAGLIEEHNKSKRLVKKRFFRPMTFLDNS